MTSNIDLVVSCVVHCIASPQHIFKFYQCLSLLRHHHHIAGRENTSFNHFGGMEIKRMSFSSMTQPQHSMTQVQFKSSLPLGPPSDLSSIRVSQVPPTYLSLPYYSANLSGWASFWKEVFRIILFPFVFPLPHMCQTVNKYLLNKTMLTRKQRRGKRMWNLLQHDPKFNGQPQE